MIGSHDRFTRDGVGDEANGETPKLEIVGIYVWIYPAFPDL